MSSAFSKIPQLYFRHFCCCLAVILLPVLSEAQVGYLARLNRACETSSNDSQRVTALGNLARYYFAIRDDETGDSLLKLQIMYARQSGNKELLLNTLYQNPRYIMQGSITRSATCVTSEATQKFLQYINECLTFSKEEGREDFVAMAYANMSNLYLGQGDYNDAVKYANLAYTAAQSSNNDSAKIVCGLQLGYTYLRQKDVLIAYKTFSSVYDLATHLRDPALLAVVYNHFSTLYKKLGQVERAKEYAANALTTDLLSHNDKGLVDDLLNLGKIYDYNDYIQKAEKLAFATNDIQGVIDAEKLLFYYQMYIIRKPEIAIRYLDGHPLVKKVFKQTGPDYINWIMAEVYFYGNDAKAALQYFKTAEPSFNEQYNVYTRQNFFGEMAAAYAATEDAPNAITNYEKALQLAYPTSSVDHIMDYAGNLGRLYEKQGDFQQALAYTNLYNRYKDTVNVLAKEKDLALMEIETANRKQLQATEAMAIARERRDNIQYMGITAAIASVFVLLILAGIFKVSVVTIRIVSFFAFIFFFEFIVLLVDHKIHALTGGEPYKVWLLKIALLSVLLPIHHKLEQRVDEYFVSKKLRLSRKKVVRKNVQHHHRPKPQIKKEEST